ncbi:MAG: hypothetical protein SGJ10_06635 [Bacteroidota bacterium]|nr:hypothetical protein [Bacteroidota bacterium]
MLYDINEIETFVYKEIKNENINKNCRFPIQLLIDSMTPFSAIDKLVEELELLGFQRFSLKTTSGCFEITLPYKSENIQLNVGALYGEHFKIRKDIIANCREKLEPITKPNNGGPATPPEPPKLVKIGIEESLYSDLNNYDSLKSKKYALVEFEGSQLSLNGKNHTAIEFAIELEKTSVVIIKPSKTNTYADLVKLLELVFDARLKQEKKLSFTILSLAEQLYIERLK